MKHIIFASEQAAMIRQQAAVEDAERRMAEAKHMVAEAMLNGGV